jgi:hypothetical protein
MAVAFNNSTDVATSTGSGTSVSFSYTSSSGTDRLLLAGTREATGKVVSAVTYAGASLTNVGSTGGIIIWDKIAPATGANTAVFTTPAYSNILTALADFTGVDQTTPLGTQVANSGTSAAPATGSITVPANGMSYGLAYQAYTVSTALMIAGTNTTLASAVTSASTHAKSAGGYSATTGTLNWNAPASAAWETLGFPINAVASGGTTYTLSPGGTVTFSGSSPFAREKVISAGGTVTFNGAATLIKTKVLSVVGSVIFSGSAPIVKTKVLSAGGLVSFSGTAPMNFIPAGSGTGNIDSRLNMLMSKTMGL